MNRFNDRENEERFPSRYPERERFRTEQTGHLGASRGDYDTREYEQNPTENERPGQGMRGQEYPQERFGSRSQYGEPYGQRGTFGNPQRERFGGYGSQEFGRGSQNWEGSQWRGPEENEFGTGYERRGEYSPYWRQEFGRSGYGQSSMGRQHMGPERSFQNYPEGGFERGTWQGQSFGSGQIQKGFESGAVGRFTGKGPKGYRRSDERIQEDINERLTMHPDIDATEIEVRVQSGEVTLTGSVDERHTKRLAEDIAESVFGVKEVQNQIRVGSGFGQSFQQHSEGSESSLTQRKSSQSSGKEK